MTNNSSSHFEWFALRWQTQASTARQWAAQRVAKLDPTWSSYIASFMPTDLELLRKKKRSLPLFSDKTLLSLGNGFKRRMEGLKARKSKRAKIEISHEFEKIDKETEESFHNESIDNSIDDEVINADGEVNSEKLVNAFIAEVRNTKPNEELPSFSGTLLRNVKGKRQLDEVSFLIGSYIKYEFLD